MSKRLLFPALAALLLTGVTFSPSPALPTATIQLAKKEEKPPAALVTAVEILKENFADTWFYTLKGSLKNQSESTILTPLIYYEIYDEVTERLIEAGTAVIEPQLLPAGEVGIFQKELNTVGKVKITLVQWQQEDQSVKSHKQMQFFPIEKTESGVSENGESQTPETTP